MIDLGDVYRIAVDVRDPGGTLSDPDTATLTVSLPDGSTATPAVPLPPAVTGKLVVDYATTQAGRHAYRLVTTAPATAYTDVFDVRPADPGMLVSLADARAHLNIPQARTDDDEEIRGFVEAMTAVVERYAGAVVPRPVTDVLDGGRCGRSGLLLTARPVLSVTSVVENGLGVAAAGWRLDASAGLLQRRLGLYEYVWQPGIANITVIYRAGRDLIPANVSRAALIVLKHMWETQRAGGGSRPGLSGEVADAATYAPNPNAYTIPYRALELLGEPVSGIA